MLITVMSVGVEAINGVFIVLLRPFSPLLKRLNLLKQSNDSGSKPDDLCSVMRFCYFKRLLEHTVQAPTPCWLISAVGGKAGATYHTSYACSHVFKPLIE